MDYAKTSAPESTFFLRLKLYSTEKGIKPLISKGKERTFYSIYISDYEIHGPFLIV